MCLEEMNSVNTDKPFISSCLFSDCEIDILLDGYIDTPEKYLTCDIDVIKKRNGFIRAVLENKSIFELFELYQSIIEGLESLKKGFDVDALLILSSLNVFYDLNDVLNKLIEKLKPLCEISDEARNIYNILKTVHVRFFGENFEMVYMSCLIDYPTSINFIFTFDDEAKIKGIALKSATSTPKRSLFKKSDMVSGFLTLPTPSQYNSLMERSNDLYLPYLYKTAFKNLIDTHTGEGRRSVVRFSIDILKLLDEINGCIKFYVGAVRFIKSFSNNYFTFAEVSSMNEKLFQVENIKHPLLKDNAICNSCELSESATIGVIGGINKGGKTTFLRAVAATQILFQLGLPVPAKKAKISPASAIVCAFAQTEEDHYNYGKLGSELVQIKESLDNLNANGMFLFNEAITASVPSECQLLTLEVLCILASLEARGFIITHFHEIHDYLDKVNNVLHTGAIFSMRTVNKNENLSQYTIVKGKPFKTGNALELYHDLKADTMRTQ